MDETSGFYPKFTDLFNEIDWVFSSRFQLTLESPLLETLKDTLRNKLDDEHRGLIYK